MVTTPIVQRTNITNEGSSSSTMVATPVPAPAPTPPGNMVAGIEKQQIVEEAERRCRGELEHMRREIETLKDSLSEQVDSEDVSYVCLCSFGWVFRQRVFKSYKVYS